MAWYEVKMRIQDKDIINKIKDCIFIDPDSMGILEEEYKFEGEEHWHYIDLAYFFGLRNELVGDKELTKDELNELNKLAEWEHYDEFVNGYLFDKDYDKKGYATLSLKQVDHYPKGMLLLISKMTPKVTYKIENKKHENGESFDVSYLLKDGETVIE